MNGNDNVNTNQQPEKGVIMNDTDSINTVPQTRDEQGQITNDVNVTDDEFHIEKHKMKETPTKLLETPNSADVDNKESYVAFTVIGDTEAFEKEWERNHGKDSLKTLRYKAVPKKPDDIFRYCIVL